MQFVTPQGLQMSLNDPSLGAHKLLFFHTETRPICHAMEATCRRSKRSGNSDSFQVVRINVSLRENQAIADLFKVRAVPTVSLISPDGKELAHSVGYQSEAKLRQGIDMIPRSTCETKKPIEPHPNVPSFKDGETVEARAMA